MCQVSNPKDFVSVVFSLLMLSIKGGIGMIYLKSWVIAKISQDYTKNEWQGKWWFHKYRKTFLKTLTEVKNENNDVAKKIVH